MNYRKLLQICLWLALGFVIILLFLWFVGLFLTAGHTASWMPEEGVWYCEDLGIQLSFSQNNETYAIIDDRKVQCTWINNKGAADFSVLVQQSDVANYDIGDSIFWGTYVSLSENEFVVEDCNSGARYVFIRYK